MKIEKLIYLHSLLVETKDLLVKASMLSPKGDTQQDGELRQLIRSASFKISYAMNRIGEITTSEES